MIRVDDGSLSVEASIVFAVLSIMILGVSDISRSIIIKQRLDRLSYSFSTILREKSLYSNGKVTQDDSHRLYESMLVMSKDLISDTQGLGMVFEVMSFKEADERIIDRIDRFTYGSECEISDFERFGALSYKSKDGSWSQLNRVSICLRTDALLNPSSSFIDLTSSSISISRT